MRKPKAKGMFSRSYAPGRIYLPSVDYQELEIDLDGEV